MVFRRFGFTLAEALTTLFVIGVVAALTIPSLLQGIEDRDRQTAFKKSLTVLDEAIQLLAAREVACTDIEDSEDLAKCFANVFISGTLDNNLLTANDGMVYAFYWRKGEKGSFADCGAYPLNTQANWEGSDANCVVVADIDGLSKHTTGFNDLSSKAAITAPAGEEQFPFIMTAHGARSAFYENSLGYKYMFGADADVNNPPWAVAEGNQGN